MSNGEYPYDCICIQRSPVYTTKEDGTWKTNNLGARHNCENETEVARLKAEHPEEPGCVNTETYRTLGLITLTRGK